MPQIVKLNPHPQAFWSRGMIVFLLVAACLALLAPILALAQEAGLPVDDAAAWAKLLLDAIRGGDWQLGVLAGLVLVVWVVRKLASRVPKLQAFVATDWGGVVLNLATIIPLTLLGAKMAGQPLTLSLVIAAVGGPTALYVMARKVLRPLAPLVARIPYIGKVLGPLFELLSGMNAKEEIAKATAAAYKPLAPVPTAPQAADALSKPPVP